MVIMLNSRVKSQSVMVLRCVYLNFTVVGFTAASTNNKTPVRLSRCHLSDLHSRKSAFALVCLMGNKPLDI